MDYERDHHPVVYTQFDMQSDRAERPPPTGRAGDYARLSLLYYRRVYLKNTRGATPATW